MAAYLPPGDVRWIPAPKSEEKTIVGMIDALNLFADIVSAARTAGTRCERATRNEEQPTQYLTLRPVLPDDALLLRQREHFDAIYRGENYAGGGTLRHLQGAQHLELAPAPFPTRRGRFCSPGMPTRDYWENDPEEPCDILKVPHHGDDKSMTQTLLTRLQPEYAVISCENAESPKKPRPAPEVLSMLLDQVPHVLCTENRLFERYPATTQTVIRLLVDCDGTISHTRI